MVSVDNAIWTLTSHALSVSWSCFVIFPKLLGCIVVVLYDSVTIFICLVLEQYYEGYCRATDSSRQREGFTSPTLAYETHSGCPGSPLRRDER